MDSSIRLKSRLSEYGKSHQNPNNRLIHKICVPAIMFSLLGLMQCIPAPAWAAPIRWDTLFILGSLIYYARFRSWQVYAIVLAQLIPMLLILSLLGPEKLYVCLGIFIIAWIGQFIGHKIEGKKPSFTEDIQFLWIGPIWVIKGNRE